MRTGEGEILDLRTKLTLTIKKPTRNTLEDLYGKKKYTASILSIFSKNRVIRLNPLSVLSPLPISPFNTLDMRLLPKIVSVKTYPDIFAFPVPLTKRVRKTLRRHRKGIVIGSVVFASLSISLVLLSLAAKNYVERETIRDYNRIASLKDMRDLGAISREINEIHGSFETIALVFSPFRAVLDNRFYSHPQIRLASNVIHG